LSLPAAEIKEAVPKLLLTIQDDPSLRRRLAQLRIAFRQLDPRRRAARPHPLAPAAAAPRQFITQFVAQDATRRSPYCVLVACYAHMSRLDDAREVRAQLQAMNPVGTPDPSSYRNAEHRELFLSGFRLAAGETE
jgi:hypothetical protein